MTRRFLPLAALALLACASHHARAASLDVTVQNLRNDHGHVLVAVCPRAQFLADTCPYNAMVKSAAPRVTLHVEGIPPGIYAVQAYQDEHDKGEVERNLLGIPTVGIGFSRDAPFRFGPPSFDDAAIAVSAKGGAIQLTLRYF